MKTNFRTAFYLRSNYVNKEGKTPVMLRIYLNNERLSLGSTGIAVEQSLSPFGVISPNGESTKIGRRQT